MLLTMLPKAIVIAIETIMIVIIIIITVIELDKAHNPVFRQCQFIG